MILVIITLDENQVKKNTYKFIIVYQSPLRRLPPGFCYGYSVIIPLKKYF